MPSDGPELAAEALELEGSNPECFKLGSGRGQSPACAVSAVTGWTVDLDASSGLSSADLRVR
jgi:hypothetical protein